MTAPVALGMSPIPITVTLPLDADFVCQFVAEEDWPDSSGVELRFHTNSADDAPVATWPATISGQNASWDVDSTVVQLVIDAAAFLVRLHYIEPDGTDLLWGRGRARTV